MKNAHAKNTVRYYLLLVVFLSFLFFSNDFGLLDIQKTAIVLAVGIDREDDTFIISSEIAIPQASRQGKSTETVQLTSRGKTVADAFQKINEKTGWYPKLVFCRLILLGRESTRYDVFDALDYFLRNEYLSDNCMVATCDGTAAELLDTTALVETSPSVAMGKVLSEHAKRVGTVLPNTLREFSIGYFSDSRCGFLPVLTTRPQRELLKAVSETSETENSSSEKVSSEDTPENAPVFSASETALFVDGKRVETFTKEETFAFSAVTNSLKLAPYSVERETNVCTLNIRHTAQKIRFSVEAGQRGCLTIRVTMTAGLSDTSKSQDIENLGDAGDIPSGIFDLAEKKLQAEIVNVYEKCRNCECDLFGLRERLEKYEKKHFRALSDSVLQNSLIRVTVCFRGVR